MNTLLRLSLHRFISECVASEESKQELGRVCSSRLGATTSTAEATAAAWVWAMVQSAQTALIGKKSRLFVCM